MEMVSLWRLYYIIMRGVSTLCVLNLNDIIWVLKSSPPEQVMCSMKVIPIGRWSLWVLLYELFPNTTEQCHLNQCYSVCPLFPIHLWAATRPTGSYLLLCLPPENGLTLISFHGLLSACPPLLWTGLAGT